MNEWIPYAVVSAIMGVAVLSALFQFILWKVRSRRGRKD